MAETIVPDIEVTTYFVETFVPVEGFDSLVVRISEGVGMYLLDLMRQQGKRIVSGVRYEFPEPLGGVEYPNGLAALRAEVDCQDFDIAV